MEHLALAARQGEDGQERQDGDQHREEDRPADGAAGRDDDLGGVARDPFAWPNRRVRWCAAFSPITTAWSIRMPTLMAIPARLMMFDDMPKSRIIRKLNRMAIGSVIETTNALPRCPITIRMASDADDHLLRDRPADGLDGPVDQRRAVVEGDDADALRAGPPEAP